MSLLTTSPAETSFQPAIQEPAAGLITKVDNLFRISLRDEQVFVDFDTFECWWEYSRRFLESHPGAEHELRIKPFLDSLKAK